MSVQVQRPKQDQRTIPTAQQSLNLVRNLMGTTLGAIAYLRGLFPEENFKDTSMGGLALKSLVRDFSVEADELMDWLERGCFDALEKQYLKTMIFGIYLSPDEPDKLVEAYTFGFSYPDKDQWCITISPNGKEEFRLRTRGEIMKATSEMLRRLLVLTQTLRPLPENAYITMRLFYYDDVTPADYEPPFFRAGDDNEKFYFAHRPEKIKIGQVETPHHALNLHVQTAADGIEPTTDDLYDEAEVAHEDAPESMFSQVDATTVVQHDDVEDAQMDEDTIAEPTQMPCPLSNVTTKLGQMDIDENGDKHEDGFQHRMDVDQANESSDAAGYRSENPPSVLQDYSMSDNGADDTQDLVQRLREGISGDESHDQGSFAISQTGSYVSEAESIDLAMEVNTQLADRLQAEDNVQETLVDQEAPDSARAVNSLDDVTGRIDRTQVSTSETGEEAHVIADVTSHAEDAGMPDHSETENALQGQHTGEQSTAAGPSGGAKTASDGDIIDCPCGINEEEFELIQCGNCNTWGHVVCFGFRTAQDKRIPKDHLCYKCLNETRQADPKYDLDYVAEVALFRRGLHIAWSEGIPTVTQFACELGVDLSLAKQVLTCLQKEGFVTDKKPAPKKQKGKKGKKPAEDDRSHHHYHVVKGAAMCGNYSRWFSKAPFTKFAPERLKDQAVERQASPEKVNENELNVAASQVSPTADSRGATTLPTPPTTAAKSTPRDSVTPESPRRVTRSMSRCSSVVSETLPLADADVGSTPSKSREQVETGMTSFSEPIGGALVNCEENDLKRKFLNQFGGISQRQMTGFISGETVDNNQGKTLGKKRPSDSSEGIITANEIKKRKVSVVARGIAVL